MIIDARPFLKRNGGFARLPDSWMIGHAVHHTASLSKLDRTQVQEIQFLQAIERIRADLGLFPYHLAGFRSGRCYLCGDLEGQRAHVAGRNHELRGIVLVGDFTREPVTDGHLAALRTGLRYMERRYPGRPIRGHGAWALATDPTACPGFDIDFAALIAPTLEEGPIDMPWFPAKLVTSRGSGINWIDDGVHLIRLATFDQRDDLAAYHGIEDESQITELDPPHFAKLQKARFVIEED